MVIGAGRRKSVEDRLRIKEAILSVVGESGYRAATVEEICERAGVSRETFERHFADLEDCYCVVFEEIGRDYLIRMAAAFEDEASWRDQLRSLAYEFLQFLQEDIGRARYMGIESLEAGERAQVIRDSIFSGLFAFIDRGRQELDDPDSLTPATAEAVGGAIFTQIRIVLEKGNVETLPELVPKMMYTAVLPYLGAEIAEEELRRPPDGGDPEAPRW